MVSWCQYFYVGAVYACLNMETKCKPWCLCSRKLLCRHPPGSAGLCTWRLMVDWLKPTGRKDNLKLSCLQWLVHFSLLQEIQWSPKGPQLLKGSTSSCITCGLRSVSEPDKGRNLESGWKGWSQSEDFQELSEADMSLETMKCWVPRKQHTALKLLLLFCPPSMALACSVNNLWCELSSSPCWLLPPNPVEWRKRLSRERGESQGLLHFHRFPFRIIDILN